MSLVPVKTVLILGGERGSCGWDFSSSNSPSEHSVFDPVLYKLGYDHRNGNGRENKIRSISFSSFLFLQDQESRQEAELIVNNAALLATPPRFVFIFSAESREAKEKRERGGGGEREKERKQITNDISENCKTVDDVGRSLRFRSI